MSIGSGDELLGTRPGLHARRAVDRREPIPEREQLALCFSQTGDLGGDLRHPVIKKSLGMAAWALPTVTDIEKLPDFAEPKTDPLSAFDEAQARHSALAVDPVPGGRPGRSRKEPAFS
jgi:hypothetical protein